MSVKIVQNISPISSVGTSSVQSDALNLSTGKLRISANNNVFVEIGQDPTATTSSLYIPQGTTEIIKFTRNRPINLVDVVAQNASHTTISVNTVGAPEKEHDFSVNDLVNIAGATDTEFNTSNSTVTEVTENTIVVEYDSSSNTSVYDGTARVYYSYKVAARTESGTGSSVYITEVQEEGN